MATPPRRVLPGASYLVTRRCSERRFFLRPSRTTTDTFLYVLAVAAKRFGVKIHVACVMSNHAHLVLTDPHARVPAFMQYLDSLVARAVNASLGRFEAFWARDGGYGGVEPLEPSDVVAKAAYVLANPVAAGLVRRGAEWPGVWTGPDQVGSTPITVRRPKGFFDPNGLMPEVAGLELTPPPRFDATEFRDKLAAALGEAEGRHRHDIEASGRRFLGRVRVLAQSPFARPAPGEPRFRLKPRIAARNRWTRVAGILGLKRFLAEYREAWLARRAGDAAVVFPAGTYLLRVLHGVPCAGSA